MIPDMVGGERRCRRPAGGGGMRRLFGMVDIVFLNVFLLPFLSRL